MTKYYEVLITKTSKQITGVKKIDQAYQTWDKYIEKCKTLEDVQDCLEGDNKYNVDYSKWTKSKIYRDEDKIPKHVGYCYASRGHEYDRKIGKYFLYYRDWVVIREIKAAIIC